ncbi:MAG TPA: helicase-related protein, partial [bacterium]|nr:helicase-related protein [bacterium]
SEKLRVLLSTEVGSEGIDLQFCSTLINYDLPWNPMKVEQRIGRIDRIGQEAEKINIINLFYEDTIDARIYDRLLVRLNIFEEALGGLEAVIGKEIRELTIELLSKRLTPEEQDEQISQRTQAIENTLVEEKRLESEASSLVAYGDYILNKINAAKELNRWINGKELFNYVADFITLHYPGSDIKLLNDEEVICTITLSSNARLDLELYLRSKKLLSTTKLISLNQTSIKYKFLNKLFAVDKKHEIINQVHPLIRFINDEMPKKKHFFHPAVNLQLSRSKLSDKFNPGIYVFSIQKWSFQGVQDIEKLFYSAALMVSAPILLSPEESEILISTVAMAGQDWYEARSIQDWPALYDILNSYCFERAEAEFQKESNRIRNKNDDMADVQLRTLELHHENQKNKLLKEIQHLREAGNDFQVRMREPRIAKLKEKIDVQKASIHKKKSLVMPQPKDICVGVIKVD